MKLDTGRMPVSRRECSEIYDSASRLLAPDLVAAHLPESYDLPGAKLRHSQRGLSEADGRA